MSKGIMIHTEEISRENKEQAIVYLKRFISTFDNDFTGENVEAVSDEAKTHGFDSDLDYSLSIHSEKNITDMVTGVMKDLKATDVERYGMVANFEVKASRDGEKLLLTYVYLVG